MIDSSAPAAPAAVDGSVDRPVPGAAPTGPGPYVEEMSREQCVALLERGVVGRVVFTVGALPAVLPVTYAVVDDAVVFRTAEGSRLARAGSGGVLAMQVDEIDAARRSGCSVVATGVAQRIEDQEEFQAVARLVQPWVPGPADAAIRLPLTVLTGRRIVGGGSSGP